MIDKLLITISSTILILLLTERAMAMSSAELMSVAHSIVDSAFMLIFWHNRHNLRRPAQWVDRTRNSSVDILIDSGGYVTESSI